MMDFIMVPVIVATIVLGIYKLFELFARRRERLALIEKLSEIKNLPIDGFSLPNYSNYKFSSGALKGGCLLVGLGLGLLIGFFICYATFPNYIQNFKDWEYRQISSLIYGACILLFGGIGLITAFVIELKMRRKDEH